MKEQNMINPYKRLEEIKQEIKQEITTFKARELVDAYIQSEQSRYMNMGHDPGTAVKMAISHLENILKME